MSRWGPLGRANCREQASRTRAIWTCFLSLWGPFGEPIVENRPLGPEPVGLCLAAGWNKLSRTGPSAPLFWMPIVEYRPLGPDLPGTPAPPTRHHSNPQTPWGRQGEPWPLGLSGKKKNYYHHNNNNNNNNIHNNINDDVKVVKVLRLRL